MVEVDWCHLFRMYWHELSIQDVLVFEHMKETSVYVCRRKKNDNDEDEYESIRLHHPIIVHMM